ncbi:hypothetical protein C7H19_23740 [Aphanothece hegewaldii CCALA 016]|uniref:Schlafen AlbA-2 domain-containing protein n=1 Tax=Aphanothece hegewaldii CCALA 016 TaxID=2107694 RepID=A0A2T1LR06_9CHRO|nr:ATP-binding protein [Aphanothece hegewaldii]PSF30527.1 hypothetical protein C7H19_23740 [Aphanothece hegewaldii CCALA 016]
MNNLPAWTDSLLSQQLSSLREKGEGQTLEFKVDFPAQAHDLAKEIAAFATAGGGKILIGIADNGALIGLEAKGAIERDKLVERAKGIVRTVEPKVKNVNFKFAFEEDMIVLCLEIPSQVEPVYYYDHRPYIRDGRDSRPAEPEEVKELCLGYYQLCEYHNLINLQTKQTLESQKRLNEIAEKNLEQVLNRLNR